MRDIRSALLAFHHPAFDAAGVIVSVNNSRRSPVPRLVNGETGVVQQATVKPSD